MTDAITVENTAEKRHLLGPFIDPLMTGGLACLFFVGLHIFVTPDASHYKLSWIMYYAGFIINYPHFMASYQLLYGDYRADILKKKTFFWAAVICPIILIGALIWLIQSAIAENDPYILGYAATFMFFAVGHHYVKQTYGCIMVTSAKVKCFYSKLEAKALWLNMYSVWAMSFLSANSYTHHQHVFFGVPYRSLGFDGIYLKIAYALVAITALFFFVLQIKKYIDQGTVMPMSALMALLAIYIWYIPLNYHPHYFLMIPFFHSLQYLLFTTTLAKNKAKHLAMQRSTGKEQRQAFIKKLSLFFGMTFVTGFLAWFWIPTTLDNHFSTTSMLGPTLFMFCFQIFLNVHHYFIDNVIWRKDNEQMKMYLTA